jgi:hypothetical protein
MQTHLKTSLYVRLVTVLCEHFGRSLNFYRPSLFFNYIAEEASTFFWNVGKLIAGICSFYEYLELHELGQTISDLAFSLIKLVTSFFSLPLGYIYTACSYDHPYMITLGLLTIGCIIVKLLFKYYPETTYSRYFKIKKMISTPIFIISFLLVLLFGFQYSAFVITIFTQTGY